MGVQQRFGGRTLEVSTGLLVRRRAQISSPSLRNGCRVRWPNRALSGQRDLARGNCPLAGAVRMPWLPAQLRHGPHSWMRKMPLLPARVGSRADSDAAAGTRCGISHSIPAFRPMQPLARSSATTNSPAGFTGADMRPPDRRTDARRGSDRSRASRALRCVARASPALLQP